MKKYCFTARLPLLIISLLSICFKVETSQASTLFFTSEVSQDLIPVNIELSNRIKLYQDHSLEEIIKSKFLENNFSMVLESNRDHYDRETGIKLMASPIASVAPVTQLASNQLLIEIGNSLNKLSWNVNRNLNHNTSKTSTILILPQADDGNVYRDIYDFEISLTDSTDINSLETSALESPLSETNKSLSNTPNNLNKAQLTINPSQEQFNIPNNLSYSPLRVSTQTVSITNTVNNIDNSITELSQNKITTGENVNLNETPEIEQHLIKINSPLKNSLSIPKNKEQEELEKKLQQQRRQLKKQQQQLYKMLEKQRQERQRKSEQEARRLQQKRQQELRQAQQIQARRQQQIQQSLSR